MPPMSPPRYETFFREGVQRMPVIRQLATLALIVTITAGPAVFAQGRPDPSTNVSAQREALRPLDSLDGVWRGKGRLLGSGGKWREIVQAERVGSILDGTVKVIEGRGLDSDGRTVFHSFATLAWDVHRQMFELHTHAHGEVGSFTFTPTDSGFVWEIPSPYDPVRYVHTVRNGHWHQVGIRTPAGRASQRFVEVDLERTGDTDWPAGGAVPPH
jgi:hypothetical protein